jgi:hypothetical protein
MTGITQWLVLLVERFVPVHLGLPIKHVCSKYPSRSAINRSVNPLKPSGNYMYQMLSQSVTMRIVFLFFMIFTVNRDYFLKQR